MKIIKIGAVWCGSCISMKNKWKDIENTYNLNTTYYDYDLDYENIEKYNIGSILPVAIFLNDDDTEICRLIGEKNKEDIIRIIEEERLM